MAESKYRHIFLSGPTYSQGFTPRSGRGATNYPVPSDRKRHSQKLKKQLEDAWKTAEEARAVSHSSRTGIYIDFFSEPGFDIKIKSLENLGSGIRLLNVRKVKKDEKEQTIATVFIPNEKRSYFLKKINEYATETTPKKKKPKHMHLIDSIKDIKLAILESFWCDDIKKVPKEKKEWVEVWLSSEEENIVSEFNQFLSENEIRKAEGKIKFPERTVELIKANKEDLDKIIEQSDDIAELRSAKKLATYYTELRNEEQIEEVKKILERTKYDKNSNVCVCILDHGVNNGHLLIQPVLDKDDMLSVVQDWGMNDDHGHGTCMAGIATYGDLVEVLNSSNNINIRHCLESSKILPPDDKPNEAPFWGYMTAQGVSIAEINKPERKRIICMAVTAMDFRDRGLPSSWSGMIDNITSGAEDDKRRIFIISAGNVYGSEYWANYPKDNLTNEIHDPGQSWNALTVGAYTEKSLIKHPDYKDWEPVAETGDLSPYSTTSCSWGKKWPIKPEVVFEGGNVARASNGSLLDIDDLQLLSTSSEPHKRQFEQFGMTSAAAAQASRMAAQIQTNYSEAWPETIRALIIHSASWTDKMKSRMPDNLKSSHERLDNYVQ